MVSWPTPGSNKSPASGHGRSGTNWCSIAAVVTQCLVRVCECRNDHYKYTLSAISWAKHEDGYAAPCTDSTFVILTRVVVRS